MVRVHGYITEMYCVPCEVRTQFICYVEESRRPLWSSGQSSWLHNGNVLCSLWGTNSIYICYVDESRPEDQRSWFDSRRYQIFCEVVGLERDPLSLMSTIEELLERKSSGSGRYSRTQNESSAFIYALYRGISTEPYAMVKTETFTYHISSCVPVSTLLKARYR
jgi:hypothetical protein